MIMMVILMVMMMIVMMAAAAFKSETEGTPELVGEQVSLSNASFLVICAQHMCINVKAFGLLRVL